MRLNGRLQLGLLLLIYTHTGCNFLQLLVGILRENRRVRINNLMKVRRYVREHQNNLHIISRQRVRTTRISPLVCIFFHSLAFQGI